MLIDAVYQGELDAAPENVLNRDFHAAAPNKKWLTDITEFQLPAGKVYHVAHDRLLRRARGQLVRGHASGC